MSAKQKSILLGGVVAGVLSSSYLAVVNVLCCLGVMVGGATAVWHYAGTAGGPVDSGDGALMGSLAGVVGSIVQGLLDTVLQPLGLDLQTIMVDVMERVYPPDMMEQIRQQMEATQGGGSLGTTIAGFLFGLVITAVFGAIGGAVGAAWFGSDEGDQAASTAGTDPAGPPAA